MYRAALAKCGMSQQDLAKKLGIAESTLISRVKKDTLTVGDANNMIALLDIDNPAEIFFTH